jgi:phosphodiesterase/alkaline phosphatase D-like protein
MSVRDGKIARVIGAGLLLLSVAVPVAFAADGSGTAVVTPTSVNAGSTGNTMTFTFTTAESMNSGEVSIAVPSGWSAPQGVAGVAGYVTGTSASGTIATVLDNADSASGWLAGTACTGGLTLDTSVKQEGTGALRCANGNENDGDLWYKTISPQNWAGYTKVGFWIRSSLPIANTGEIRFAYDDNADLATPIEQIELSQTIAANTWTYVVVNFGATTRTSVASFGFYVRHNGNIDNNTIWIDDVLIGPGVPTFPGGGQIRARLLQLGAAQTVTLTYGSGGGASGANAPASGETSIFTSSARISSAGTLAAIASSPIVTVFNPVPTTTDISPTSRVAGSGAFTITVNGTNFVPASVVRFNGSDRSTTYNSATQLTASILAGDVISPGSHAISVFNSTPNGGTSNAQTLTVTADVTAPAAVTNLALSGATTSSMVVTWTSPGDDGNVGTATLYDLRYSTAPIVTLGDFTAAALVSGEPAPSANGTVQNMTVTGLSANTLYYFAMKTSDEASNVSAVSNVPSLSTVANPDTVPPSSTTTLALSGATTSSMVVTWTSPGDDGNVGTATLYDLRYSTAPIVTLADFTAAAQVIGEPAPSVAGTVQSMTVTGLSANTLYYFAKKAQDEVPNLSAVSNVVSLSTAANPDVTAPTAISDLVLSGPTTSSLTLFWTATGDDGTGGTAALYDIRYSTAPISTAADFSTASLVSGEPIPPSTAGTVQNMTVTGLSANTTYFFAMKAQDEVPNLSLVSNVPSLATAANPDTTAPSSITTLALSGATTSSIVLTWTATGDDGGVGTANLYDIRYSTAPIVTSADYTAASMVSGEPIPTPAGTIQTRTVTGLSANTTYFFGMKAQDEVPNISLLSNTPSLSTAASPDTVAPAAVTNLSLQGTSTSSLVVIWGAPGDDGGVGTAALYDIRYSTAPIVTEADFTAASQVSGEPTPGPPAGFQGMTVAGLSANTTYFFVMKSQDEVPNISPVSNMASRTTVAAADTSPPSAVTDLSLSGAGTVSMLLNWTAPGDDGTVGTAALYDIRYSTAPIVTEADFTTAFSVVGEASPVIAGTPQSMTVGGLSSGTTYYFAMKTQDEAPNISSVSNTPSLSTISGGGGGGVTDITTPTAVTDLALSGATAFSMVLTWTAPGDDNNSGFASLYDIRYSTSPIVTPADFSAASLVTTEPYPASAGMTQSMTVGNLAAGKSYFFAMKAQDEAQNVSSVSNVPSLSTLGGIAGSHNDATPPTSSSVSASSITRNSVVITWLTNENADALVRFGPTVALGGTVVDGTFSLKHLVPILSLTPGTKYHYTVCSSDFYGNQACLGEFVFTTLPADAPTPTYGAAEALVGSPTISVDKGLAAPAAGTTAPCISGTLIKQPSDGNPATQADSAVYYCGADGKRYAFPNADTYHSWYPDFSGVRVVSVAELATVPFGGSVTYRPGTQMIKVQSDPKVYAVAKGGTLRWVTTEAVAQALYGLLWKSLISDVSDAFFTHYVVGAPILIADVLPLAPVTAPPPATPPPACATATTFTEFLNFGSNNAQVLPMQELLQCLGFFSTGVVANGYFGPTTEDAVKKFQSANGIEPVGYVGPATRAVLNHY